MKSFIGWFIDWLNSLFIEYSACCNAPLERKEWGYYGDKASYVCSKCGKKVH